MFRQRPVVILSVECRVSVRVSNLSMHPDQSQRRTDDSALLRAIVDQFVERTMHPVADIKQFEQLAIGMIDLVDAGAVARIMRPLCFHPETPQAIFDRLFARGGPCAELALQFSPSVARADLVIAAQHRDSAFACAVARRSDLDREIVEVLIQRADAAPLRALAANAAAHLDASVRRALTTAARDDMTLARVLLDRDDGGADCEALFLAATRHERMNIILNACRRALAAGQVEAHSADPGLVSRLEAAAVRNDRAEMAGIFADAFECRKERARAILADTQGEPLALALAALGLDPDAATRIFLCADSAIAHDTDRVRSLVALVRSTPQRAAAQIIGSITGAKADRDLPRRFNARDEALAGPGRRRVTPRANAAPIQKVDQSA